MSHRGAGVGSGRRGPGQGRGTGRRWAEQLVVVENRASSWGHASLLLTLEGRPGLCLQWGGTQYQALYWSWAVLNPASVCARLTSPWTGAPPSTSVPGVSKAEVMVIPSWGIFLTRDRTPASTTSPVWPRWTLYHWPQSPVLVPGTHLCLFPKPGLSSMALRQACGNKPLCMVENCFPACLSALLASL